MYEQVAAIQRALGQIMMALSPVLGGHCLQMQGLVHAVGVSNYGPRQLEKIHRYLSERGVPLASVQASRARGQM